MQVGTDTVPTIFALWKQLEGQICCFSLLKKSVLAIKSAQKSTKKSVLAIKSAQKSTIKSKQKPQKNAQKSATKKSAKKVQNIVLIKVWGLLKVPKKVRKKVLLLIKVPKKAL